MLHIARGVLGKVVGILDGQALGHHHLDGMTHVIGVTLDEVAQAPLGEELVGILLVGGLAQVEGHIGTVIIRAVALPRCSGLDGVAFDAVGLPRKGLVRPKGTTHHAHARGNHEAGVEAHTKLADDVHRIALGVAVLLLECLRTRVRDGAEVLLELGLGHANAVVADGDGARILVIAHANGEVVLANVD